jgi:hypothetical protein
MAGCHGQVSVLPLSRIALIADAGYMSNQDRTHQDKEPVIHRIARGIADAVAEDRETQRILYDVRMNPARYLYGASRTPDTYTEFLIWTSGVLRHEPSARERASGRHYLG